MQYSEGTVAVTSGSAAIVGTGTTWSTDGVVAGMLFTIAGSGVSYQIASVTDDTHATLTANYGGSTASGQSYVINSGATTNRKLPYWEKGDIETATLIKDAMLKLDNLLGATYTANRVLYTDASGNITTSSGLQYNGTTLTTGAIGASGAITQGSGSGTSAGLVLDYYGTSGYGAIWTTAVGSRTSSNYLVASNGAVAALNGSTNSQLRIGGSLIVDATSTGAAVTGTGAFSGALSTTDTTASTSSTTGALKVSGGAGFAKGIVVGSSSNRGTVTIIGTSGAGPIVDTTDNQTGGKNIQFGQGINAGGEFGVYNVTDSVSMLRITSAGNVRLVNNKTIQALNTDNSTWHDLIGLTQGSPTNQIGIGDSTRTIYALGSMVVTGLSSSYALSSTGNATAGQAAIFTMANTTATTSAVDIHHKATSGDNSYIKFYENTSPALTGSISYNRGGGVTAFNTTSARHQKIIFGAADRQKSRQIVLGTPLRDYAWRSNPMKRQIGVIADEVLASGFKGAVQRNRYGGAEGVDKTAWVFHSVATLQLHDDDIEDMKGRLAQLERAAVANGWALH